MAVIHFRRPICCLQLPPLPFSSAAPRNFLQQSGGPAPTLGDLDEVIWKEGIWKEVDLESGDLEGGDFEGRGLSRIWEVGIWKVGNWKEGDLGGKFVAFVLKISLFMQTKPTRNMFGFEVQSAGFRAARNWMTPFQVLRGFLRSSCCAQQHDSPFLFAR